jgi:hypothetical protein
VGTWRSKQWDYRVSGLSIRSAWLLTLQFLKSFFPAPFDFYHLQRHELPSALLRLGRLPSPSQEPTNASSRWYRCLDTEPHPFRKWRPEICSSCYRRGLELRKQMAAADRQDTVAGIDLDASVEHGRGEVATPEPGLSSPSPPASSPPASPGPAAPLLVRVVDAQGKNVVMRGPLRSGWTAGTQASRRFCLPLKLRRDGPQSSGGHRPSNNQLS